MSEIINLIQTSKAVDDHHSIKLKHIKRQIDQVYEEEAQE